MDKYKNMYTCFGGPSQPL